MRVIRLPDGKWQVDVRGKLPNGELYRKRLSPKVTSRSAAAAFGERHWQAVIRGELEAPSAFPTLAVFYNGDFKRIHFESSKRGPLKASQRESYESHWRAHLKKRFGDWRLDEITEHEIRRFAAELGTGRSQKTVNNVLTSLATILARARDWLKLEAPKIEIGKLEQEEIEYWSFADFDKLATEATRRGGQHAVVLLLGCRAGLRAGEMLSLRWDDVDFDRRMLSIRKATWQGHEDKPKSNKRRYVPIAADLAAALSALPRKGARVIRAPRKKVATIETLRGMMGAIEGGAGFKDEKGETKGAIHKLRHTFGAHLAMRGASLLFIQQLMGHSSPTVTMRYAHLAPSTLASVVDSLGIVLLLPPPSQTVYSNALHITAERSTLDFDDSSLESSK